MKFFEQFQGAKRHVDTGAPSLFLFSSCSSGKWKPFYSLSFSPLINSNVAPPPPPHTGGGGILDSPCLSSFALYTQIGQIVN